MRKVNDVTDACNAGVCDTGRENCTVVSRKSNNMNDARNYADQPVRPTNEQQFLADDSDNKVVDETDYISEVSNLINGCGTDDSKKSIFAVKRIGDMNVTVIPAENPLIRKAAEEQFLSDHDKQMDRRRKPPSDPSWKERVYAGMRWRSMTRKQKQHILSIRTGQGKMCCEKGENNYEKAVS